MPGHRVILALGANIDGPWGKPEASLRAALAVLGRHGVALLAVSSLHESAPVGPVGQPPYVNAVALAGTDLAPGPLLAELKAIEAEAGRTPGPRWGPRTLDIDILDHGGQVLGWERPHDWEHPGDLVLPHPELHKRRFVLEPLMEILPGWRHPVLGLTVAEMLAALPADQRQE